MAETYEPITVPELSDYTSTPADTDELIIHTDGGLQRIDYSAFADALFNTLLNKTFEVGDDRPEGAQTCSAWLNQILTRVSSLHDLFKTAVVTQGGITIPGSTNASATLTPTKTFGTLTYTLLGFTEIGVENDPDGGNGSSFCNIYHAWEQTTGTITVQMRNTSAASCKVQVKAKCLLINSYWYSAS